MEAALLYAYGDLAQLRYEETDLPKYGDHEVLVKVHATSIKSHRLETKKRSSQISHASDVAGHLRERPLRCSGGSRS